MEKIQNRRYDTVVFDLDGTLLDTLADLTDSVNAVMRQFRIPEHTMDDVRRFVGNGIRKLIERAIPQGSENPDYEAIYRSFTEYYGEHCMEKTRPYPGIIELLDWLQKEGCKVAIVSNKADFAVKRLNQIYFENRILVAIGEREGVRKKPAPDTVFQALQELGADKEHAVYIGDSDVDIDTARNCGIDEIAVDWGFRSRKFLLDHGAAPERIASSADDVKRLLSYCL